MEKMFDEKEMAIIYDSLFIYKGSVDLHDPEQKEKHDVFIDVMNKIKENYNFDEIKKLQINL